MGQSSTLGTVDEGEGPSVHGSVVDDELLPIDNATVTVAGVDGFVLTGADGRFAVGLSSEGTYVVHAEKTGYASVDVSVRVPDGPANVLLALRPVAADVPYHETQIFLSYAQCLVSVGPAAAPCIGTVDYVAGTGLSQDAVTHNFQVVPEGLANLLLEMSFRPQNLGKEGIVTVREPGSLYSGAQKSWLLQWGPSPVRAWLTPGGVGKGGRDKFEEPPHTKYMATISGWNSNATVPMVALFLEFRAENHLNFFYNRPGAYDFTSLPDQ